jgi:mannose-6-phosphate isomerase-like protein (cupin superfamily)
MISSPAIEFGRERLRQLRLPVVGRQEQALPGAADCGDLNRTTAGKIDAAANQGRSGGIVSKLIVKGKFASPVDRAAVAADWRARGYSCDLFVDLPGRAWKDFVHRSNELVTVAEGQLELVVGDTRLVALPGDEVFIPKGAVHSVRNTHSATTRWRYGYD